MNRKTRIATNYVNVMDRVRTTDRSPIAIPYTPLVRPVDPHNIDLGTLIRFIDRKSR